MAEADDSERNRERNEHGQYADRIPAEAALEVFENREDQARPLTASEVMEELDCSRRTAHNKLNELVDRDLLETRKVGARSRVWWIPIRHGTVGTAGRPRDDTAPNGPENLAVVRAIEAVDLPGSGRTLEQRREALRAAYDYLIEHPSAKKGDFLADVFPENPAGYETADGWWNTIQPALRQLPGVDPPEEHGHIWHFLGRG